MIMTFGSNDVHAHNRGLFVIIVEEAGLFIMFEGQLRIFIDIGV